MDTIDAEEQKLPVYAVDNDLYVKYNKRVYKVVRNNFDNRQTFTNFTLKIDNKTHRTKEFDFNLFMIIDLCNFYMGDDSLFYRKVGPFYHIWEGDGSGNGDGIGGKTLYDWNLDD